jgi:hypothetical protein
MVMISALTRSLLALPEDRAIEIHVRPQNRQYVISVEVEGFVLEKNHRRMVFALEDLLADLSTRVHGQLVAQARQIDAT